MVGAEGDNFGKQFARETQYVRVRFGSPDGRGAFLLGLVGNEAHGRFELIHEDVILGEGHWAILTIAQYEKCLMRGAADVVIQSDAVSESEIREIRETLARMDSGD